MFFWGGGGKHFQIQEVIHIIVCTSWRHNYDAGNCAFFMYLYEYLVVDDNLNKIVKEGEWEVSNDACEADIIEGGNLKYLKNVLYHCCCFLDEKSCPLHIDKPTFQRFAHYSVMRRKQEWQRYITSIYTKFHTVLVKMYFTAEVDMPEDFGSELSQFMLGTGGLSICKGN